MASKKKRPKKPEQDLDSNPDQVEMFYKARLDYTTILNTMIDKGEMADLGTDCVCILLVMRRHTQVYETNDPYCKISKRKIAELTGLSERTVNRKISILEEKGYVKTRNHGYKKSNSYILTEKILAVAQTDELSDKVLTHRFIPFLRQKRVNEIRYFEKHNILPARSPIDVKRADKEFKNYQNFNININITNNFAPQVQNQVNITVQNENALDLSTLPRWLQDKVLPRINEQAEKSTRSLKEDIQGIIHEAQQEEAGDDDDES